MRIVLQRVKQARVSIQARETAGIGQGVLLLVGFGKQDTPALRGSSQWNKLIQKITRLRIFPDKGNKLNLSLLDTRGELLVVSQFTLYANCKKGLRPSFDQAAPPDIAGDLFSWFVADLKENAPELKVDTGVFGAEMDIEFTNWGPVTIVLDSELL